MEILQSVFAVISSHPYLFAIGVIILIQSYLKGKRCNLPGPYGLPLVGYMPFMDRVHPYKTITKLGRKYGEIFQVQIGRANFVVLNSLEVIQDAFGRRSEFSGRPDNISIKVFAESGPTRFAFKSGEQWRFLRKISAKSLGMFASSRNSKLDTVLQDSFGDLEGAIHPILGKPTYPKQQFKSTIAGVIGSVLFGFDFDPKNKLIDELIDQTAKFNDFLKLGGLIDNVPLAEYLLKKKIKEFTDMINVVNTITEEYIAKHEYHDDEDNVRDVADALTKVATELSTQEMKDHDVDEVKIRFIAQDLFGAGFPTTLETFLWMLNLLSHYTNIQEKIQAELDQRVGTRKPNLNDKGKLPYLEATFAEILRFVSLVPLGLPHATTQDVVFNGYFIPKGTSVVANYYGCHYDEKTFPDPHSFRPERFLNNDGSFNSDLAVNVTPFGIGKRRCVGELLARQELFFLISSVLQRYTVQLAPGQKFNPHEAGGGFIRIPLNMDLVFEERNINA